MLNLNHSIYIIIEKKNKGYIFLITEGILINTLCFHFECNKNEIVDDNKTQENSHFLYRKEKPLTCNVQSNHSSL